MPDHLHALLEALDESADLVKCVAMFKQRTAHRFRRSDRAGLWQSGFYEHVLRDDEASLAVTAYILANPIRAGLCQNIADYPFSGSSRYGMAELADAVQWRRWRP